MTQAQTDTPGRTGRVLVADDESPNRAVARAALEKGGHEVVEAADGEQAMRAIAAAPPHVILLDVMMPGVDGLEVCRRVRADPETASIPVLMITALAGRDERLRGIQAGATDFLSKPVDFQELLLRVGNAVFAKRLFDENLSLRRHLEERVAEQTVELRQAHDRLAFHVRELDARDRLSHLQAQGPDVDAAAEEILDAVADVLVADRFVLYLPEGDALAPRAARIGGEFRLRPEGPSLSLADPGTVSEAWSTKGLRRGSDSTVAVPLLFRGEPLGVLHVAGLDLAHGDDTVLSASWRLAREAALLLRMARTTEDLESGRTDLTALLDLDS